MTSARTRSAGRPAAGALKLSTLVALSSALLLAGCASPGRLADRTLPQPVETEALGATATDTVWPSERWWLAFDAGGAGSASTTLDALIDRALEGQPSLAVAAARLEQAEAAVGVSRAAQRPQVQLSVDLTDQRYTEKGMVPAPIAGNHYWNNNATLGLSWELDLFGRQRAALAAAIGQTRSASAELQAARVALTSQITATWVQLARQIELKTLGDATLQRRLELRSLAVERLRAGLDTQVELHLAEGAIAQARTELAQLDEGISRSRHALAELSGQPPQTLATLAPVLPPPQASALPTTLPADLLGRRADLVAQRWRVESALRDVDVARTQFYPNVNLSAFIGLSSLGLDNFLNAGARTYGAGPALRLPVFDGGRLRAQLGARQAEVQAAVSGYDAALLRALREVADEVGTLQALQRQQASQRGAVAAAEGQRSLAQDRAEAGLATRLTFLQTDLGVLVQQRADLDLRARTLLAQVALAKALGGGWQAVPDALPTLSTAQR